MLTFTWPVTFGLRNQSLPVWSLLDLLFKEGTHVEKAQSGQCLIVFYRCCSSLWSTLPSHCCFCTCLLHHAPPPKNIRWFHTVHKQQASQPGINLSTDQSMSPGADKPTSMGSVWLRTISLNSRNIPEKQTLQHLPYGERHGSTAHRNERREKAACAEVVC